MTIRSQNLLAPLPPLPPTPTPICGDPSIGRVSQGSLSFAIRPHVNKHLYVFGRLRTPHPPPPPPPSLPPSFSCSLHPSFPLFLPPTHHTDSREDNRGKILSLCRIIRRVGVLMAAAVEFQAAYNAEDLVLCCMSVIPNRFGRRTPSDTFRKSVYPLIFQVNSATSPLRTIYTVHSTSRIIAVKVPGIPFPTLWYKIGTGYFDYYNGA